MFIDKQAWEQSRLGSLAQVESGKRMRGGGLSNGDVLSIGGEHIGDDGCLRLVKPKFITKAFYEGMKKGKIFGGDVLVVKDGATTGKAAFVSGQFPKAAVNEHVFTIRSLDSERLCREFLFYFLLSEDGKSQLLRNFHGIIGGIKGDDVRSIIVRLPGIREQRAIAQGLDAVQRAKEARQRELALERERKAALMEHLFTHGTRGEPTKQTEIGEIPESWHIVQLGEIARIGNGSTPKRSDERYWKDGTIPWITSTQIHDVVIKHPGEFVTEKARRECHLPLVPKGSIVVAITGQGKTLGNAAILAIDTCINQHLAYIQLAQPSVRAQFALVYLQSRYSYLRGIALSGGSTKGALTCGFLKTVSVPVPSLDEQSSISGLLLACEKKRKCLERELTVLDELFKCMLEELMAGRLSAVPLIEEHQAQ